MTAVPAVAAAAAVGVSARWAAYGDAVVYLGTPGGPVGVRPAPQGWTSGEFPGPGGQVIHVITAYNPAGTVADPDANAAAQARLEAELTRRRLAAADALTGHRDPARTHVEPSAAVISLRPGAAEIGRRSGQDAIFEFTPAFRLIVDCDGGTITSAGWSIELIPGGHPERGRAFAAPRRPTMRSYLLTSMWRDESRQCWRNKHRMMPIALA